jgi:hypothetical protein
MAKKKSSSGNLGSIVIDISGQSYIDYHILPLHKDYRDFFPAYKHNFTLSTNVGERTAHATSASFGTNPGNPNSGQYICGRLRKWFEQNAISVGDKVKVKQIQKHRSYELEII